MKICFASHNENKVREIRELLGEDFEVVSLTEVGVTEEIEENAASLEGNSEIKALYVWENLNIPCFADDTGLEVEALDGAPGVYSARYAGEEKDSEKNTDKLLGALKGSNNRKARFRTVLTFADSKGKQQFEGIVEGTILHQRAGKEGFGYDPVFKPDETELSFAEMSTEGKNRISHRGRALRKFIAFLKDYHADSE